MSAARKPNARLPLSYELVIDTALNLADEEGIEALSMRHLGQALGVKAMSLYNHVANKEALLDGLVDRVFAEIVTPAPDGLWAAEMRKCAVSKRDALQRHPWAVGLLESRTNPGPENLRHHDAVLGCLHSAGLTVTDVVHAYSAIDSYVYGFALQQVSLPFDNAAEQKEVMEAMMQASPMTDYPHSAKLGMELMRTGYEYSDEFEWGLDVLLEGLGAALTGQRG
jgi:AcrR family transcriptional regulator